MGKRIINLLIESTGRQLRAMGYQKLNSERDARYKRDAGWKTEMADNGDWYGLPPSTTTPRTSTPSSIPFETTEQGNKFRKWVNDTYPNYAKEINLDVEGKFNNSYIKKAWNKYGQEYKNYVENLTPNKSAETPSQPKDDTKKPSKGLTQTEIDLKSYSDASGFSSWTNKPEVEKRMDKIKELLDINAQSDVFRYFKTALELAKTVYPDNSSFYEKQLSKISNADSSKNPTENEVKSGIYTAIDLGSTGLWTPGRYYYYVSAKTTGSMKGIIDKYKRDGWQDKGGQPLNQNEVNLYDVINLEDLEPETFREPYYLVRYIMDLETDVIIDELERFVVSGDYSEKNCKRIIGNYYSLYKKEESGVQIPITQANLMKFKNAVNRCDSNNKNFLDFNMTNKKLIKLKATTDKKLKLSLSEQLSTKPLNNSISIKKTIKENLIMEKQKRLLSETKVIENRLQFVIESVGLKNKKDVDRIVEGIFYEMLFLENKNYNREILTENIQAIFDVLGSLFGGTKDSVVGTFKEKGINYILTKLGLDKNSYMGDFLEVVFGNVDLKDIPKLFTDCDFLTKKIAEAVPEAYLKNLQDEKGFDSIFMDYVRNALYDVIRESDIVDKLEDRIAGIVCPITAGLTSKFEDKLTSIKSSLS